MMPGSECGRGVGVEGKVAEGCFEGSEEVVLGHSEWSPSSPRSVVLL